jgi:hypothetical protein
VDAQARMVSVFHKAALDAREQCIAATDEHNGTLAVEERLFLEQRPERQRSAFSAAVSPCPPCVSLLQHVEAQRTRETLARRRWS